MYGDMGCGKTFTVAYVVDYLRSDPHKTIKPLVCSYFCKDDGEMNQVKNIFRSLLSQLLAAKESLRWHFHEWYRTRQGNTQVDPTQSINELRALLVKLVISLRQALYIVIDALDECSDEARADLVDFFEQIRREPGQSAAGSSDLQEQAGLVRVFTSSRYGDHSRIPSGTEIICMPNNAQRDLCIVRHLSSRYLEKLTLPTRELVTNKVAAKMQGSAIWARMVLQYLQKTCSRTTREASIERTLHDIPQPQGLSELYVRLFEKVVGDVADNRWILARSLDLMAAARRQLTLRELSYAVCIEYAPSEKAKSLGGMTEADDYERILDLVRPFVSVEESSSRQTSPNAYVRLVHQSLKQVIMRLPPYEWTTTSGITCNTTKLFRAAELNGLVLHLCIDYLLLQEFGTQELVPDQSIEGFQTTYFEISQIQFDQSSEKVLEVPDEFDPYAKGFGGFYTYAACYWTAHYEDVAQEYMPNLEDLIALSQPGSIRMKNWLDRMRQPDWRVDLERSAHRGYNPLALVAWFGSEVALEELLNHGLPALGLADKELRTSAIMSAAKQAVDYEKFYVVKVLLNHPTTTSTFQEDQDMEILILMVNKWRLLKASGVESWSQLTELMLEKFRDTLTHHANLVLLMAARSDCLPVVKRLFEAAKTDQQIRSGLMQRTCDDWGPIGWAGSFGHVEIVRYLCEQKGIESHLYHQDPFGDNIYHFVARNGNPEALRVLVRNFPEGVHQANGSTTPLQVAVNHGQSLEAVKILLLEGQADVNAGDPYFMPLRCAVRNGRPDMCRTLIVQGNANPWTVVGVSDVGIPFLHERTQAPTVYALQVQQETLREVCSLMPLAVSVFFLLPATSAF